MDVETTYKFDGDAKVSEVAGFIREKHVGRGWSTDGTEGGKPDTEASRVGAYRSGALLLEVVEHYESSRD